MSGGKVTNCPQIDLVLPFDLIFPPKFRNKISRHLQNVQVPMLSTVKSSDACDSNSPPDAPLSDSDTSEPGCADHLVCDGWGPATFKKSHGLSALKKHVEIKMVRRDYKIEELMQQMASSSEDQEAFFVVDLTTVLEKLARWKDLMPRVKPFYAVKCK